MEDHAVAAENPVCKYVTSAKQHYSYLCVNESAAREGVKSSSMIMYVKRTQDESSKKRSVFPGPSRFVGTPFHSFCSHHFIFHLYSQVDISTRLSQ